MNIGSIGFNSYIPFGKLSTIESHCCCNGEEDPKIKVLRRRLKQLLEVVKRLQSQLSMAKTQTERNSILMRIDRVMAEIADVEREIKTG